jgi:hypothetical protein
MRARKNSNHAALTFQSPDGVVWTVKVQLPGASNAMVVFLHPDGRTARKDRYNWINARTPEAQNVTARLDPRAIEQSLTEQQLALLFRRSMLISAADDPRRIPVTQFAVG